MSNDLDRMSKTCIRSTTSCCQRYTSTAIAVSAAIMLCELVKYGPVAKKYNVISVVNVDEQLHDL